VRTIVAVAFRPAGILMAVPPVLISALPLVSRTAAERPPIVVVPVT
jgi:hypothetical protein